MLTNEAVARAVLEADVKVAAFYPGSPTSEILDMLYPQDGGKQQIHSPLEICYIAGNHVSNDHIGAQDWTRLREETR